MNNVRHHRTHPSQQALTYGDYWVQFHDIAHRVIRFGHVLTRDELREQMVDEGMVATDIEFMIRMADAAREEQGILYSIRYDFVHHPDGVGDSVVKGHVWPIEARLFAAAQQVRWQVDQLPHWGKVLLNLAWRQQRAAIKEGQQ